MHGKASRCDVGIRAYALIDFGCLTLSAVTSTLTRNATRAVMPRAFAALDMASTSGSLSALNWPMPAANAASISSSVLPTPENTIRSGCIPAARARASSPPDTMSAPSPLRAASAMTPSAEFALMA